MTCWTRIHLTTTTPVFNGNGDPNNAEIRVPSIRGIMRFWVRAMAGIFAADRLTDLRDIEDDILGSTGASSPIKLRIPNPPKSKLDSDPRFLLPEPSASNSGSARKEQHRDWLCYLLGPGITSWNKEKGKMLLKRAHIPPGQEFELRLRFTGRKERENAHICAVTALWLGLTYGGIGARTRRGFGGVRITGVQGELPGPWDANNFVTPDLKWYSNKNTIWLRGIPLEAKNALQEIARSKGIASPGRFDGHPTYPVLSTEHTMAGISFKSYSSWNDTLVHAGEELRSFRARNHQRSARYRPPLKTDEWSNTIHGDSTEFPLGALGLPVVFRKGIEVHADQGKGADALKLRRASPLCFRPVGQGDRWALFSYGFFTELLPGPNAPSVHLWRNQIQDKELTVTSADAHEKVREWINNISAPKDAPT